MQAIIKYPRMFGATETQEVSIEVEQQPLPEVILEGVYDKFNAGSDRECKVFQESNMRSLSPGDFVGLQFHYGWRWFQCAPVGWKEVTKERVDEVMVMPAYDTWQDKTLR